MRVLAVDFGGARIGLAVGESSHQVSTPRGTLNASGKLRLDAEHIVSAAHTEGAGLIVIGLPLDAEGETKMARICRKLGAEIESLGKAVAFVDESLTSAESEQTMIQAGLKGSERRRRVDQEAACRILDRFFTEHG